MKILFAFENPLPNAEADAEVFITTARYLAPLAGRAWLHVPVSGEAGRAAVAEMTGMAVVGAWAPLRPGALRHFFCGLTIVLRREFREADLVYTRNLWVAWLSVLFGQRVAFDHYRPWSDQIPPLQLWLYRLICNRRFLINICHSNYTRDKYLGLGIPPQKLICIHNGFEPRRFAAPVPAAEAKRRIGIVEDQKTIVYTGRINRKKGLGLVVEAAKRLPDLLFVLVGSYGEGPIETMARSVANIRIIPWQTPEGLGDYVFAADVLLIPPSMKPLAEFGSTVLPLKLFFYMGSGRPVIAGDTADVRELLQHDENAVLCRPDSVESLVAAIRGLTDDGDRAARLAAAALANSGDFTWEARTRKIASIVERRLRAAGAERGGWSRVQARAWTHQSWRWLMHLLREGSWVLPPGATAAPALSAEPE